jgi:hypothetical protein
LNRLEFTPDRYTRCLLTVIAALLTVIAVELAVQRPDITTAVQAQIPDAGAQRYQILGEGQRTNQLLEDILVHLRTKPIKVEMETGGADKPTKQRTQSR